MPDPLWNLIEHALEAQHKHTTAVLKTLDRDLQDRTLRERNKARQALYDAVQALVEAVRPLLWSEEPFGPDATVLTMEITAGELRALRAAHNALEEAQ